MGRGGCSGIHRIECNFLVRTSNMEKHSVSVWFFIGLLLAIYGLLVLGSGVYELLSPLNTQIAMAHLHIGIWWGAGMLLLGLVYLIRFRPGRNTAH